MTQAPISDAAATAEISRLNSEFWNELCGTHLATTLGITDDSRESLKKFDDWYMAYYPYLRDHIPFGEMRGKRVLEVGLGYGTVSQLLAQTGADFSALDIAAGPVDMVKHRLRLNRLAGTAQVGSILSAPFDDNTFDHVVTIGCLHHTGDLQRALDEVYRILKPGGRCSFMVYHAYSYRQLWEKPGRTVTAMAADILRMGSRPKASAHERGHYDRNAAGDAAPSTDFVSRRQLRRMCRRYGSFRARLENIAQEGPFAKRPREELLTTPWPRFVGLDVYCRAVK
jgi:SAM-dependent methyltransferase